MSDRPLSVRDFNFVINVYSVKRMFTNRVLQGCW